MAKSSIVKTILKDVRPLFTKVICSSEKYSDAEAYNDAGIFESSKLGAVKELQTITALSTYAESLGLKVGDKVLLNFTRYAVYKQKKSNSIKEDLDEHYSQVTRYELPIISINGVDQLMLDTSDIVLVVNDYEVVTTAAKSNLIIT